MRPLRVHCRLTRRPAPARLDALIVDGRGRDLLTPGLAERIPLLVLPGERSSDAPRSAPGRAALHLDA